MTSRLRARNSALFQLHRRYAEAFGIECASSRPGIGVTHPNSGSTEATPVNLSHGRLSVLIRRITLQIALDEG